MWDLPVHDLMPGLDFILEKVCHGYVCLSPAPKQCPCGTPDFARSGRVHESPTCLCETSDKVRQPSAVGTLQIQIGGGWTSTEAHSSSHQASVISRGVRGVGGLDSPEASTFGSAWPEPMAFGRGSLLYGTMFFSSENSLSQSVSLSIYIYIYMYIFSLFVKYIDIYI